MPHPVAPLVHTMPLTRRHRDLFLAAAVSTTLLVALGGVVCITDASRGCPDWPACYGRLLPPRRLDSILEYTHRVAAAVTSLSIAAAAIIGWRKYRTVRWLSRPPAIAIIFLLAVIAFGAMVVLRGLEPGLAALDLGSALVVQALTVVAAVVAAARHRDPDLPDRLSLGSPLARLAVWTVVAVWIVLVSAVLVAESGSPVRCLGWPLFDGQLDLSQARDWLQAVRQFAGALAGVLVVALVARAWRSPRPVARSAMALGLLFWAEIGNGVLLVTYGPTLLLQVTYIALAAGVWASLAALLVLAAWPRKGD